MRRCSKAQPTTLLAIGLLKDLCESSSNDVLMDDTLSDCDRLDYNRADRSHQHRRHGVNAQSITARTGRLL